MATLLSLSLLLNKENVQEDQAQLTPPARSGIGWKGWKGRRGRDVPEAIRGLCRCPREYTNRNLCGQNFQYRRHLSGCIGKATADDFHQLCQWSAVVGGIYVFSVSKDWEHWRSTVLRSDVRFKQHRAVRLQIGDKVVVLTSFAPSDFHKKLSNDAIGELVLRAHTRKQQGNRVLEWLGNVTSRQLSRLHFKIGVLHVNCARSRFAEAQWCTIKKIEETLDLLGLGNGAFEQLEFEYVRGEYRYQAYDLVDELWRLIVDAQDGTIEAAESSLELVKLRWQEFRHGEIKRRRGLLGIPELPDVGSFTLSTECGQAFNSLITENSADARPYLYQEVGEQAKKIYGPTVDEYYKMAANIPESTRLWIEENIKSAQEFIDISEHKDKASAALLLVIETMRIKMQDIPPGMESQYLSWGLI